MKCFKVFGKKCYPGLMLYQAGLHMVAVPCIIISLIMLIMGDNAAAILLVLCLLLELFSFLTSFNSKEALRIDKEGWPDIDIFY